MQSVGRNDGPPACVSVSVSSRRRFHASEMLSASSLMCPVLLPALAAAQQTGVISGKVVGTDNLAIPGVTIEARADGPAHAPRDDHGERRRVPDAGPAAWRLHGHLRAVRHGDGHAAGQGPAGPRHHGERDDGASAA